MGRTRKTATEALDAAAVHLSGKAGNVTKEVMQKHWSAISALQGDLRSAQQALKTAWDAAESDGISKKPFKAALKLLQDDPAAADAYVRSFQQYTTQLGLFDRIEQWKQAEENADNAASVDAAERELADA